MPHRLAGHPETIISILCIAFAALLAYLLSQPKWRQQGARLAGLLLLLVGLILLLESIAGYQIRPVLLGIVDEVKPGLILLQGLLAMASGVYLLMQKLSPSSEILLTKNEPQRFGATSRYIHWTTAILFLALIPMGIYTSMIPEDAWYRHAYYVVHKTLGFTVLALLAVRVVWNFVSARPAISPALKPWEKKTAHVAHYVLYFLLIGLPLSGYLMSSFGGKPMHFFAWDLPVMLAADEDLMLPFGLLHKIVLPYLCYLVLGLHIIGALKHQIIDKHSQALNRMVG